MFAMPAAAQESGDYPPEVDGEVVDSDDETVVDDAVEADAGEAEAVVTADAEGGALAQTGADTGLLLLGGITLLVLGSLALLALRSGRSHAQRN